MTCQSISNGFVLEGTGSTVGPSINYEWIFDNTIIGSEITIEVFEEGVYTLLVTDSENGCEDSEDIEINIPVVDLDPIMAINGESCFGEADGSLFIDTVIGGQAPYLFALMSDNFTTNNVFENLQPGNYTLTIQDADGCESQTEVIISPASSLIVDLGDDQHINLGDSLELSFFTNMIIDTIIWDFEESLSCLDCQEPMVNPFEQTNYTVTLIDVNGCIESDQITIFVDKRRNVYIPNTFSPNDDGFNDYFMIYGGPEVEIIHDFKIYNRWGAVMYSASNFSPNDPLFAWDGRHRGKEVNPAVFVYFAEIEFVDGRKEILRGDITLTK